MCWGQWYIVWDMLMMVYIMTCHAMAHRKRWLAGQAKPMSDHQSRIMVAFLHFFGILVAYIFTVSGMGGIILVRHSVLLN